MNYKNLIPLILCFVLFSCKKEVESGAVSPIPSSPPQVPAALLKDVIVSRLPSPYYHFEYDESGNVRFASFASDFFRYDVMYDGDRISEMRNNILVNKDRLKYSYSPEGKISAIDYTNSTGVVYTRIHFLFNGRNLIRVERERLSAIGFITDKILTMSYYPDGNLMTLTYHYLPFNGQPEITFSDYFDLYDDKINVDSFSLIHNEFDHFFLLTGIQLQKNNPGKEIRTGTVEDYEVNYTYSYNEKNLPVSKDGELIFVTGPNTGRRFQVGTTYSYY